MKIVKSLEKSGLLIKGARETIENVAKEQKVGFLGMLLDTLSSSLLGNMLSGKETRETSQDRGVNIAAEGTIKAAILMPLPPLTNFEIQSTKRKYNFF